MNRYFIGFTGHTAEYDTPAVPTKHWDFGDFRVTRVSPTPEIENIHMMALTAAEPDKFHEIRERFANGFDKYWYAIVCGAAVSDEEADETRFAVRPKLVWIKAESEADVEKAVGVAGVEIYFHTDTYLGFECEVDAAGEFVPYIYKS